MYEKFYKLTGTPFSLTPDSEVFYMSPHHAQALATLRYAILTNAGLTVVTGEVGTGKTTLVRRVLQGDKNHNITVGVIQNTHPKLERMLPWIMSVFGLDPSDCSEIQQYQRYTQFLRNQFKEGKRTVLIVDEAQNLQVDALEEIRLLSNLNVEGETIFQIILVGQPELNEKLELDELRQLSQRVTVDYAVGELSYEHTNGYIDFRLGSFGGKPEIFDKFARAVVFYHSHGIPRVINNICHLAMAFGYADSAPVIGMETVKKVIESKKVSMGFLNRRFRSQEAFEVHSKFMAEYGADIATLSILDPPPAPANEQQR